jgi:hypothetical protein
MTQSSVSNSFCLTPTPKRGEKRLSIEVTFKWDITQSEWGELKQQQKTWENEVQKKLEYDPTFMFYVLNDITVPTLKQTRLNGVVKKVKLG